jgi:superfamily I DNA and/or RNA helicase
MILCARIAGGKSIGFLEDMARLNVGLTRAKLALILIGNLDTLAVSR